MKTIVIEDAFLKILLRKDINEDIIETVRSLLNITRAAYFDHHIVKNYYQEDFIVSSIMTNERWQDLYWKEYWHNDPLERKVYKNAMSNGSSIIPWDTIESLGECMQARKKTCDIVEGVTICYKNVNSFFESFSFGWSKNEKNNLSSDFFKNIEKKIQEIRIFHLEHFYSY